MVIAYRSGSLSGCTHRPTQSRTPQIRPPMIHRATVMLLCPHAILCQRIALDALHDFLKRVTHAAHSAARGW